MPVLHHDQAALGVRVSASEDEFLDVSWNLAPETRESAQEGRNSASVAIPFAGGKARHAGGSGRAAAVGAQSRVDAHDAVVNERGREGVAGEQTVRCYQVENRLGVREGQRAALLRAKKLLIERRTRPARRTRAQTIVNEQTC